MQDGASVRWRHGHFLHYDNISERAYIWFERISGIELAELLKLIHQAANSEEPVSRSGESPRDIAEPRSYFANE
jgi:hypothetical protein